MGLNASNERLVKIEIWNPVTKMKVPKWVPQSALKEISKIKIRRDPEEAFPPPKPRKASTFPTLAAPDDDPIHPIRLTRMTKRDRVDAIVHHYTGFHIHQLTKVVTGGQRGRAREELARRRWLLFWIYVEMEGNSLSQIGSLLGFNHTSIIYALKHVDKLDQRVLTEIKGLYEEIEFLKTNNILEGVS